MEMTPGLAIMILLGICVSPFIIIMFICFFDYIKWYFKYDFKGIKNTFIRRMLRKRFPKLYEKYVVDYTTKKNIKSVSRRDFTIKKNLKVKL